MALFAVAFRIRQDAGYGDRRASVAESLAQVAEPVFSADPVLFSLVQFDRASSDLTRAVSQGSKLVTATDLMMAINLSQKGFAYFGNAAESDMRRIMERR